MIDENYNWGLINEINEAITEELGISDKVIELSDNIYIEIVKAFNSEKSTIIENGVGRKYGWITYPLDDNIILNISYDIINFADKKYMEEYAKKKGLNTNSDGWQIEIFDTGIAFVSGLMIVPAVYLFSGGDESAMKAGSGLMFITLPKVFAGMPLGTVIGAVFFLLVLFAALTSSISLMETVVSIIRDKTSLSRRKAALLTLGFSILLGIPSSLGFGLWSGIRPLGMSILDFFDFVSNSVLMPLVAFLTCIFVVWFVGLQSIVDEVKLSSRFKQEKMFCVMIRYIAPVCIILILVSSVLNSLGVIKI